MPTIATKLPAPLAKEVRRVAKSRKTTPSRLVREAIETELFSHPAAQTFGEKFGHLLGVAGKLPPRASEVEGYAE